MQHTQIPNFIRLNFSNWLKSFTNHTFHSFISPFQLDGQKRKIQLNLSTSTGQHGTQFSYFGGSILSENRILKILLLPHTSLIGFVYITYDGTIDNVLSTNEVYSMDKILSLSFTDFILFNAIMYNTFASASGFVTMYALNFSFEISLSNLIALHSPILSWTMDSVRNCVLQICYVLLDTTFASNGHNNCTITSI